MSTFCISLPRCDVDYSSQVRYAMSFASEDIASYDLTESGVLSVQLSAGADERLVREKVDRLLERYTDPRFGLKEVVHFKQSRDLPVFDAWTELLQRQWVALVGQGHVVLRGLAARLFRCINAKVLAEFAAPIGADEEFYPSTILCATLDRTAHFTSFPEHVDFVSHLREDVEVLAKFSQEARSHGWRPEIHKDTMSPVDLAICPSACYHCYESMQGWRLAKPGRAVTTMVNCHRYEAGNLTTMSRLRSFHMREVVWVGHPEFVKNSRIEADRILLQWAKDWEIDCTFENANDMFFTDDYAVKASFQRQQEAKRELRLRIPFENRSISCSSSNFHAATFGKAFDIQVDGRHATSACMGWGCERWLYAIFSQFGLDEATWPGGLRGDLDRWAPAARGTGP
jgi:seryl-tRNA synthetase